MGWLIAAALVVFFVGAVAVAFQNQTANNAKLGASASQVKRVPGVNYLGGHPQQPNPATGCTLIFSPDEIAIEKGANLLFRLPIAQVEAIHIETEEDAKRRITATRILATGIFALAIPKKTPGSVLINLDTEQGPLAFEKTKTTKVATAKLLGPQIARVNALPRPVLAPLATPPRDVADELRKLVALRAEGLLSEDEFQNQRKRLLDG